MLTYRRIAWPTMVVVIAALVGLPGATLYNNWNAVTAIERHDSIQTFIVEPWGSETVNQSWYTKLFGRVGYLRFGELTVHVSDMRDFAKLRGLESLHFDEATDAAWRCLPRQLTRLNVCQPETGLSSEAWEAIGQLRHLEGLCLHWGPPCDDELRTLLQSAPRLTELQLHETPVSNATIESIVSLRALSGLSLCHTGLTDHDVEVISRHPGIVWLDLHDNRALTDACLTRLARMPALKGLSISITPPEPTENGMPPPRPLSEEGLENLRKLRPDMTVSDMQGPICR